MTPSGPRWRPFVIWLAACCSLALLWTMTTGDDVYDALWRTYGAATVASNVLGSAVIVATAYVWSDGRNMRQRVMRVALAVAGAGLPLALLEVPVVTLGYDYGFVLGTHTNDTWLQLATGVNRRDEELLHIHQPHTRYVGAVAGNLKRLGIPEYPLYAVDVAYDKNGFRNPEDLSHAAVVAIGDSFVEGAETAWERTAVARIGHELGVTVANLGQSNYGPQQELAVLRRFALALSPKIVVWFFFGGNDMGDVDSYEWRRAHLDEFLKPRSLSSRTFSRNALKAIAGLTTPARRIESSSARPYRIEFLEKSGRLETLYLDAEEQPWTTHQWDAVSHTLLSARNDTRRVGAELLVVYVPRKLRAYAGFVRAESGAFANVWPEEKLPDALDAWCRSNGIPFLDSTAALRNAVASGQSVYLPDDVHWNEAGHAVVASAVAEHIRTHGYLNVRPDGVAP